MSDNMVTGAASSRQRSLAAFFAATFLGLALFFLIVGLSRQHSAMLAGAGALAICGLALLLVVLRLNKKAARESGEIPEQEDYSGDPGEADEMAGNDCQGTAQADIDELAAAEPERMSGPVKSGQLPEPRPRNEERLFEHKTDDLLDSVNYR